MLKYNTVRLDLLNSGSKDNTIEIMDYDDSNLFKSYPKWFESDEGRGLMVQSSKGSLNLKIQFIKDGIFRLRIRGPDIRDKTGKRFPVFVDYTKLQVNGVDLINNNVLASHDNNYNLIN